MQLNSKRHFVENKITVHQFFKWDENENSLCELATFNSKILNQLVPLPNLIAFSFL